MITAMRLYAQRVPAKIAARRVAFGGHLTVYLATLLFLAVVASLYTAVVVGLAWGIGLVSHFYSRVLAPELRARWTESEAEAEAPRPELTERGMERLAASVAHEIRNPVAAVKSLVQQVAETPAHPDNAEYARVALGELDRVERSIAHLLRYAREEPLQVGAARLSEIMESALGTFGDRLEGVEVSRSLESVELRADAEQLRRVFINLVGNALDAMEDDDTPARRLSLSCGRNLAGTQAWAKVGDSGPGMRAEQAERIFEPFYTGKSRGTGLGLALVSKVAAAHGGTIEVSSEPGIGTEFTLQLPRRP